MTVLLDILHPAHVHFFRNAISELRARGERVLVTSRDKDLTHPLLDHYGIPYQCISREARSRPGLARELWSRNRALWSIVRRERPSVMASIGGITTAQVGLLTRTPNYVFYDTENAWLSNLLTYPFATRVITPDCYHGRVGRNHETYPGYHELAYLHPSRFRPDPERLRAHGIDPTRVFSVVRFVSWRAVHDVKARGFSESAKRKLVETLSRHGDVFITSEGEIPPELERHRLALPAHEIHHLLAEAHLFVGESATMASESAILGTPAVYVDPVGRGYTDEQESRYGLCTTFRPVQSAETIRRADEILASRLKTDPTFRAGVARLLEDKTDVTSIILDRLGSGPRNTSSC